MKSILRVNKLFAIVLALAMMASVAFAAGPQWMPGFPMRMGTNIMLMWMPIPGATAYNVYKSEKPGELGAKIISQPANNYMDMNVPNDKSAYYTVKPVTGAAEGDASPVGAIVAIKPLDPPTWQGFLPMEEGVSIRFGTVAGASFYNLFKAAAKEGPYNLIGSIQEPKYVDSAIKPGEKAYYQVSAIDKNNFESPKSEVLEVELKKAEKAVIAKTYTLSLKPMKHMGYIFGAEDPPRELLSPGRVIADAEKGLFYVADAKGIVCFDVNKKLIREFNKPSDYQGLWGSVSGLNLSNDRKQVLSTYSNPMIARIWDVATGELAAEFEIAKPTKEEYEAKGRLADWEEDSKRFPEMVVSSICEDPEGNFWIGENYFHQLHIYNSNADLIKKIGEPRLRNFEDKDIRAISNLRFHPKSGNIYAVASTEKMLRIFSTKDKDFIKDKDGNPFYGIKIGGSGPGFFQEARGIDVMGDGNLVVVDGIDGRVQVLNPMGEYLYTLTTDVKAGLPTSKEIAGPQSVAASGDRLLFAETLMGRLSLVNLNVK